MSSRHSRFWSLWWRFGGDTARRNLAAGDAAKARSEYLRTINEWLQFNADWKQWEIAAVYADDAKVAGRRLGDALGASDPGICFDLARLEVPSTDPRLLIDAMDAAYENWCAAAAELRALDPAAPDPVRDHHHDAALRRPVD